jgi:hypothetical protein
MTNTVDFALAIPAAHDYKASPKCASVRFASLHGDNSLVLICANEQARKSATIPLRRSKLADQISVSHKPKLTGNQRSERALCTSR